VASFRPGTKGLIKDKDYIVCLNRLIRRCDGN
jgi:hypothetical protein